MEQLNLYKPLDALEQRAPQVNRKLAWLQQHVKDAKGKLTPLKEELANSGVHKDNTYLFIQGHHLMENVVDAALDPVCTILRREREKGHQTPGQRQPAATQQRIGQLLTQPVPTHADAAPQHPIQRMRSIPDAPHSYSDIHEPCRRKASWHSVSRHHFSLILNTVAERGSAV